MAKDRRDAGFPPGFTTDPPPEAATPPAAVGPGLMPEVPGGLSAADYLLAQQVKAALEAERRQEWLETVRADCGLTAAERTQRAADQQFQGPRRFRVSIPQQPKNVDPGQLAVEINAHSEEEARGRYDVLCGIKLSEHPYEIKEVSRGGAD